MAFFRSRAPSGRNEAQLRTNKHTRSPPRARARAARVFYIARARRDALGAERAGREAAPEAAGGAQYFMPRSACDQSVVSADERSFWPNAECAVMSYAGIFLRNMSRFPGCENVWSCLSCARGRGGDATAVEA